MKAFLRLSRPSLVFLFGLFVISLLPLSAIAQQFGAIVGLNNSVTVGADSKAEYHSVGDELGNINLATLSNNLEVFGSKSFTAHAISETKATATQGQLKGYCRTYAAFGGTDATQEVATGSAIIDARWRDSLVVTSSALPKNSPVQIEFFATLSGIIEQFPYTGNRQNDARLDADFGIFDPKSADYHIHFNYTDFAPPSETQTYVLNTFVGDTIYLSGDLYMNAFSQGNYTYNLPLGTIMDYGHTMNSFADPVTPDVTLISASGHDYLSAQAAPEPFSLALIIVLLAALLIRLMWLRRGGNERTKSAICVVPTGKSISATFHHSR